MPSSPPFFFIINPTSGNHQAGKQWAKWQLRIKEQGLTMQSAFTEKKGDGIRIAKAALQNGFRQLVVVGGDGTLNEVLNGCFEKGQLLFPNIKLGVIPLGTGNDWVKTHNINIKNCLMPIHQNISVPHDIGILLFKKEGSMQQRLFLNIASFGFAGTVVKKKAQTNGKVGWGAGQYIVSLLQALSSQQPFYGSVSMDDQVIADDFFNISAGNGKFFGGGMKILPHATFHDSKLHVSIVKKIGKWKVVRNVPRLFNGTYIKNQEAKLYAAEHIRLKFETPVYCEAEGELLAHSDEFEISILKKAIQVFSLANG